LKIIAFSRFARKMAHPLFSAFAWPLAVGATVYTALLIAGTKLLNDGDTLWHVAAGNWTIAHRVIPVTDPFSHSLAGAPWVAHEWLAEVLLAALFRGFGWTCVVIAAAFTGALAFALLTSELQKHLPPKLTLATIGASFLLAAPHMTVRPHIFAMPLLAAWMVGLVSARSEGRTPSFHLLPVMTLWANLHGGFIVGLGLCGVIAVEAVLAASPQERASTARQWMGFVASTFVASLLTPHGISVWLFPFQLMSLDYSLNMISEWHAPDFTKVQILELWLVGLAAVLIYYRPQASLVRWLLLVGIVFMAVRHERNAELLAIVGPLLLAEPLGRAAASAPDTAPAPVAQGAGVAILLATLAACFQSYAPSNSQTLPAQALAAAAEAGVAGPVFNHYDFGGYLIFKGQPVFVDGRVDLYKDDFMRTYFDAVAGVRLFDLLDGYGIGWTMLRPGDGATKALDASPNWQRIYAGGEAVVHRRLTQAASETQTKPLE
jgi:hypothetical protein